MIRVAGSPLQGKAANGRRPAGQTPTPQKADRYSYQGDSPSSSSLSPGAAAAGPTAHRHRERTHCTLTHTVPFTRQMSRHWLA